MTRKYQQTESINKHQQKANTNKRMVKRLRAGGGKLINIIIRNNNAHAQSPRRGILNGILNSYYRYPGTMNEYPGTIVVLSIITWTQNDLILKYRYHFMHNAIDIDQRIIIDNNRSDNSGARELVSFLKVGSGAPFVRRCRRADSEGH